MHMSTSASHQAVVGAQPRSCPHVLPARQQLLVPKRRLERQYARICSKHERRRKAAHTQCSVDPVVANTSSQVVISELTTRPSLITPLLGLGQRHVLSD